MTISGPILVTGGRGQLGGAIARRARARDIAVETPGRDMLDILDPAAIDRALAARPWAALINCAAYTAVDRAESEPEQARAVNATAAGRLAESTARAAIPILHVSTDYVFDGRKDAAYDEDDPIAPINLYGATKAEGEAAVRAANPAHKIVRTAWLVSTGPANFVATMLRLARERDTIGVVADQLGCPTGADDLADALLTIAADPGLSGTWHFTNAGETSWHGLAAYIFARLGEAGLRVPSLDALTSAQYPTPAKRPRNSRLATGAITRDFGIVPRPWQEMIDAVLAERFATRED